MTYPPKLTGPFTLSWDGLGRTGPEGIRKRREVLDRLPKGVQGSSLLLLGNSVSAYVKLHRQPILLLLPPNYRYHNNDYYYLPTNRTYAIEHIIATAQEISALSDFPVGTNRHPTAKLNAGPSLVHTLSYVTTSKRTGENIISEGLV